MKLNVKSELQEHISAISTTTGLTIRCMECFVHNPDIESEDEYLTVCYLPCGYGEEDKQAFLKQLDLEYDDFYEEDGLTVDGCIWWSDGSWSWRDIDNDSLRELWLYHKSPPIPAHLKGKSMSNVVSLFGNKN